MDEIKALFIEKREQVRAELEAILAARPAAHQDLAEARKAAHAEGVRFNRIAGRITVAVRNTDYGTAPALAEAFEEARRRLNQAEARAERARRDVANLEWRLQSLRDDLEQIERAITPPQLEHRPEVVKRPLPPGLQRVELIEFPSSGFAHAAPAG
ncbi:MAG TPA: hypothetical protein VJ770_19225 [Stellaceae bacterium]|nr:hypothetical protein [Stellaceae bacterium]